MYGPDHPEVAVTLTNLGIVQQELGDLPAGRATLQRALAIFEAVYGPNIQRSEPLHPPIHRDVVDVDAALGE